MPEEILVLSPHTDDAELACGGSIAKFVEDGNNVRVRIFAPIRQELIEECRKSLKVLGVGDILFYDFSKREFPEQRQRILQTLWDYNEKWRPDVVLCPATSDTHQDHQVVTEEAVRAFKYSTVLGYFCYWNSTRITENCFNPITELHLSKKLEALKCYGSQVKRDYFDHEYLWSLARSRGGQIRNHYAEAFEVIRLIL